MTYRLSIIFLFSLTTIYQLQGQENKSEQQSLASRNSFSRAWIPLPGLPAPAAASVAATAASTATCDPGFCSQGSPTLMNLCTAKACVAGSTCQCGEPPNCAIVTCICPADICANPVCTNPTCTSTETCKCLSGNEDTNACTTACFVN